MLLIQVSNQWTCCIVLIHATVTVCICNSERHFICCMLVLKLCDNFVYLNNEDECS